MRGQAGRSGPIEGDRSQSQRGADARPDRARSPRETVSAHPRFDRGEEPAERRPARAVEPAKNPDEHSDAERSGVDEQSTRALGPRAADESGAAHHTDPGDASGELPAPAVVAGARIGRYLVLERLGESGGR